MGSSSGGHYYYPSDFPILQHVQLQLNEKAISVDNDLSLLRSMKE